MTDLTLYDYAASANCLKARVLLAQVGRPYRRVDVDLAARPAVSAWIERVQATPGFVDDLEPYPENALPGRGSRPEM